MSTLRNTCEAAVLAEITIVDYLLVFFFRKEYWVGYKYERAH